MLLGKPGQILFRNGDRSRSSPRGLDIHVDVSMQEVIRLNLIAPPFELAKKRVEYLKKWTARAKEIASEEENLRETMPAHVRRVLGPKRLVLFGEMLEDLQYPDKQLVGDISAGFRLSGYMTKSNIFRARSKRPAMSLETLRKLGKTFNANSVESFSRRQESELEEATWKETESELEKGWIFLDTEKSTEGKFLGRRFGIRQGAKIRVIDDCTCCGLNLTEGLHALSLRSCSLCLLPGPGWGKTLMLIVATRASSP